MADESASAPSLNANAFHQQQQQQAAAGPAPQQQQEQPQQHGAGAGAGAAAPASMTNPAGFAPGQIPPQSSPQTLGIVAMGGAGGSSSGIMTGHQQAHGSLASIHQQQQPNAVASPQLLASANLAQPYGAGSTPAHMNLQQAQQSKQQPLGNRSQVMAMSNQLNPASSPQQAASVQVQSPPGNLGIPRSASGVRLAAQPNSGVRATSLGSQYGAAMPSGGGTMQQPQQQAALMAQRAAQVQAASAQQRPATPGQAMQQHASVQSPHLGTQSLSHAAMHSSRQQFGQFPAGINRPMGGQVVTSQIPQYNTSPQLQARQKQGQYTLAQYATSSTAGAQMGSMTGVGSQRTPGSLTSLQQSRIAQMPNRPLMQPQQQQQQLQHMSQQQTSPQKLQNQPSSGTVLQASSNQAQQHWVPKQQTAAGSYSMLQSSQAKQGQSQYPQQLHQLHHQAHIMQQQQQPGRAQPALQRPATPTGTQPGTPSGRPSTSGGQPSDSGNRILGKRSIQELVAQVDPNERLDPEVEDILLEIADDFIESVTTFACKLAKHRKSNVLEVKDILLHLNKNWDLNIPGFGGEEYRSYKKMPVNEAHKQRLALIKKSSLVSQQTGQESVAMKAPGGQAANPNVGSQPPTII